ncbi:MAG: thiamine-phosphate pyrophosphorylase [Candidatus Omnitrophica bacterium]|nr:thiamine-phosphate pyrophosphorylase [Candidatus Omnitrophota bacterium]
MHRKIALAQFQRVIDANYNRSKEGLRVCEDLCRFVWNDRKSTAAFKKIRHSLTGAIISFGLKDIVASRDIVRDVGRATVASESLRKDVSDIFYANIQRVKESLRVLEEFAKLQDVPASVLLKKLRYSVYEIEKNILARF